MKRNDSADSDIKITTKEESSMGEQIKPKEGIRIINTDSGVIFKTSEPISECNPNNGAFFEERSNPLSSKGN
ncbi:MAG: hypothetical protein K0S41_2472 [Anaerocolumna sp.]|jgi:hypothetical protein|nr:hypothetical protein [Anaerocolumna sp.]